MRVRAVNKIGESEACELLESVILKEKLLAPEITLDLHLRREVVIRVGEMLKINAKIEGIPVPDVEWKFNDKHLDTKTFKIKT